MATLSTRESPFKSFSSRSSRKYDVFLNFRGEDTRRNFTDHLLSALKREGFITYRDEDELERGQDIPTELLKAIEDTRISVIIFSKNYADSRWCLDELVRIMECKRNMRQMVVPVFFDVDPSDVRAQTGYFGEPFKKHEERYNGLGMETKIENWRKALTDAANLSGWALQNVANGHESKFIEMIVEDISIKLDIKDLYVTTYPIGIESRAQHIKYLLSMVDVRLLGIFGISGLGKTTISKAAYNLICRSFEGSSFLQNVRDISKQPNGLVGLQKQFLSDVLKKEYRNIRNVDHGIEVIKQRLQSQRILLVLDDVDDIEQIKAFAVGHGWFYSGSRVILTTRDEFFLNRMKVDRKYMPEPLNNEESLQLFSWHAFATYCPIEGYIELSKEVVCYAGGLPSSLENLGLFFSNKSMDEWIMTLEQLKGRNARRDIVSSEHCQQPHKGSSGWYHKDIVEILRNRKRAQAGGLVFDMPKSNVDVQLSAQPPAKMEILRLLKLCCVSQVDSRAQLSSNIEWLGWYGIPTKSIPHNFFREQVIAIDLRYSNLQHVWEGMKGLYALGQIGIFVSQSDFPDWFNYQNVGRILTFLMSPLMNVNIQGLILCVDFSFLREEHFFAMPYIVQNKYKKFSTINTILPHLERDRYAPQPHHQFPLDAGVSINENIISPPLAIANNDSADKPTFSKKIQKVAIQICRVLFCCYFFELCSNS